MAPALKRGYSLVSVMAAFVVLMAVLAPLIPLQGRLFRRAHFEMEASALRVIEQDMAAAQEHGGTRERVLPHPHLRIERRRASKEEHLDLITYRVSNNDGKLLFEIKRYQYVPDP